MRKLLLQLSQYITNIQDFQQPWNSSLITVYMHFVRLYNKIRSSQSTIPRLVSSGRQGKRRQTSFRAVHSAYSRKRRLNLTSRRWHRRKEKPLQQHRQLRVQQGRLSHRQGMRMYRWLSREKDVFAFLRCELNLIIHYGLYVRVRCEKGVCQYKL